MFNRYAYTEGNPINAIDPDGRACNFVTYNLLRSHYCKRSQRMARIAEDPSISSKTTFASAASVILEGFGGASAGIPTPMISGSSTVYFAKISKDLEGYNNKMFEAIRMGGGFSSKDIAKNDSDFVRYEQSIVQIYLNTIKANDPNGYTRLISDANGILNGDLGHSDIMRTVLDNARDNLGVESLDFANEAHRVEIGEQLTKEIRNNSKWFVLVQE